METLGDKGGGEATEGIDVNKLSDNCSVAAFRLFVFR
jgi:hypothetical protein